jgi:uncharacterized protein
MIVGGRQNPAHTPIDNSQSTIHNRQSTIAPMTQIALDEKYARLRQILRKLDSVAVAFSAGVDSTFLLKVAVDTLGPDKVVAVTGRSDSLARAELEQACELARGETIAAEHVIIETDEFDNPEYTANPTNRCYFCKSNLFALLQRFIAQRGLNAVVCGTNADDLGDFRPGLDAAIEHGVSSPVAQAGLTKLEVRELSHRLGLPTFDKPATPCLSSRVPYGEPVTREKLRMIEAAEAFLRELGIAECRVRHHDANYELRITNYEWRTANSEKPQSAIRNPQSAIPNPPGAMPTLASAACDQSMTSARERGHATRPVVPTNPQSPIPNPQSAIRNRPLARIEVPVEFIPKLAEPETAAKINAYFRSLGYNHVSLDLRGFRSGSMNEAIGLTIAD